MNHARDMLFDWMCFLMWCIFSWPTISFIMTWYNNHSFFANIALMPLFSFFVHTAILYSVWYCFNYSCRSCRLPGIKPPMVAHLGGTGISVVALVWRSHDGVQMVPWMHQFGENEWPVTLQVTLVLLQRLLSNLCVFMIWVSKEAPHQHMSFQICLRTLTS